MASRAEEKELRRQKRLAHEQAAREQARRKRVLGYAAAGVLSAASIAAIVVAVGGGSKSSAGSGSPFGTHYAGLEQRRQAADVSTMGAPQSSTHIHPVLSVYVNGKKVPVPANIGIDPSRPFTEMAGLHTHDASGTIHDEGMAV